MANANIFVTARRISPNKGVDLTQPKRVPIEVATIKSRVTNTRRGGSVIKLEGSVYRGGRKFEVFETLNQLDTLVAPASTEFVPEFGTVNATGSTQGGAAAILAYLTKVGTATAATQDGLLLPAATVGKVRAIQNAHASVPIDVFPATGEFIKSKAGVTAAVNVAVTIPVGETWHFACLVAGVWSVAVD
jgi:hypothetical protein